MALYFVINRKGYEETIPLQEGMIIGRGQADIELNDPSVSSRHAAVGKDPSGVWTLVDLNSKNGIYFEGRKIKQLHLEHGVNFTVGKFLFKTVEIENTSATVTTPSVYETWQSKVSRVAKKIAASVPAEINPPDFLSHAISLDFITGIQANTRWVIGYVPRSFGSEVPEFTLLEEGAPAIAFKIKKSSQGIVFETEFPAKVLLNGKAISSDLLKPGDEIIIAQTRIRIGQAK